MHFVIRFEKRPSDNRVIRSELRLLSHLLWQERKTDDGRACFLGYMDEADITGSRRSHLPRQLLSAAGLSECSHLPLQILLTVEATE
jgi:hypothetical protein